MMSSSVVVSQVKSKVVVEDDPTVAAATTVGQKRSVEEENLSENVASGGKDEERKKRLRLEVEEVSMNNDQRDEVTSSNHETTAAMEVEKIKCKNNDDGVGGSLFTILPTDLRERVSTFLQTREAFQLSRTCKSIKNDLALTVTNPPFRLFKAKCWNGHTRNGDKPRRDREIPIFFPAVRIHSVVVKCTLRDQGHGNQKGRLYIVGHPKQDDDDEEADIDDGHHKKAMMKFSNGRVVAQSPIAEHHDTELQLSFHPLVDEQYHLWYKAGSGGGHRLHVYNLDVYTVMHDTNEGSMSKAFQFLSPSTSDLVFPTLLQALSRSLLGNFQTKPNQPDPILSAFLNKFGVTTINEASVLGLENVANIFLQDHWVDLTYDEKIDNLLMYIHYNDSQGGDLFNALHFLTNGKFLHPTPSRKLFTASVHAVTESLVAQINRKKEFPDPILSDLLQSYGVSVEKESLLILQKLSSMMQEHSEEEQPGRTNQQDEDDDAEEEEEEEGEENNDGDEDGEGDGDGDGDGDGEGNNGNDDAAAQDENADDEDQDQPEADDDDEDNVENENADGENGNDDGEGANEPPVDDDDINDAGDLEIANDEVAVNEQPADDIDEENGGNVNVEVANL